MDTINIKDLKYEDIEECYNLTMEVFNENNNLEDIKELYKKYSNQKDTYRFLVAKMNGKIVGYTSCVIGYNLFDGKNPFMTLWYVCVHPEFRRKGIATKLFDEIEKVAIEQNCEFVYFISGINRTEAHTFYKNLGYKADGNLAFIKFL